MRLLFIQGGSRWRFDSDGNIYTDTNFNENIWERYRGYCDELTVILRCDQVIYNPKEAIKRFNKYNIDRSSFVALPDLYKPVRNVFSISIRRSIEKTIDQEIEKADKIIIRSLGNIYTNTALKSAKKYHKPYLVEVTGFAREGLWYHSFRGKLVAWPREFHCRYLMKDVPYAVYVTDEALQKRYPCKGRSLGCSDVEIHDMDDKILEKRLEKIRGGGNKLILGTAALLDTRWKGQVTVIKALARLKKEGFTNIEYYLIGVGSGCYIKKMCRKFGVEDQVNIIGALPHDEVYKWMDSIDIYVQPSFQEGLCRSIIEAMTRGCPVIASDVGGNYELISHEYLFKAGDVKQLANRIRKINDREELIRQTIVNFEHSKKFHNLTLDSARDEFYNLFISE